MSDKRLTPEEFVFLAFEKLRNPKYKGLHTVYSGFNQAFRRYFPDLDPKEEVQKLAEAGKVDFRLARGGALIYPKGEAPFSAPSSGKELLGKMGLD